MSQLNFNDFPELQSSLRLVDFRFETQKQIVKDFGSVGYDFSSDLDSMDISLEEMEMGISQAIATIMEKGERQLLQLLYVIDLPEKQFLSLTTQSDFLSQITQLVIKREAYKVWLRKKYSS